MKLFRVPARGYTVREYDYIVAECYAEAALLCADDVDSIELLSSCVIVQGAAKELG